MDVDSEMVVASIYGKTSVHRPVKCHVAWFPDGDFLSFPGKKCVKIKLNFLSYEKNSVK